MAYPCQDTLEAAGAIIAGSLPGKSVTIAIDTQDDGTRYLNAQVTRFHKIGQVDRYTEYQAELSPWLWYATRTSDCKIFQHKTVVQIADEVLADYPFPVKKQLFDSYKEIGYAVQYNETDFDFLSRLLAQEGIYYFFEHAEGSHTLVLTDFINGHHPLPHYETLRFMPAGQSSRTGEECVVSWDISETIKPGQFVTDDYDFKKPRARLQQIRSTPREHAHADYEQYHWGHGFTDPGHGEHLTRVHLEALQHEQVRIRAETDARGMAPGYTFKLFQHPDPAQNADYLVTGATYHFNENSYASGDDDPPQWRISFTALKSTEQYRPPKAKPWPIVQGIHTATVVGPAGEEIWTDSYGRVKLQFPWDRYGKSDENSSCWVRSASVWAGSNFGGVHIPRIGQEVLVSYVNGEINRPIIIGRVYNQDQMPPWELPANATQSGILSRSTKGANYGNANAIRFEDKKGAEQVWIQAERNMDTQVENDETHHVMHDRTKTIDHDETVFVHHDRTETVDHDETITVHNDRKERVDHNETISIGDNRTEEVGKNESVTIGDNRTNKIGKNHDEDIGESHTIKIGHNLTETVTMAATQNVGLAKLTNVGGAYSINVALAMNTLVGMSQSEQVIMNKSGKVGQDYSVNVGKKFTIEVGEEFEIIVGDAKFVMKKDGTIEVTGKDILQKGTDNISCKAGSSIVIKAPKTDVN